MVEVGGLSEEIVLLVDDDRQWDRRGLGKSHVPPLRNLYRSTVVDAASSAVHTEAAELSLSGRGG